MAIFKCKMCGGEINAVDGAAFGTCDSCGITSTFPKANDEKLVNLFNRANHFRRLNEFDKALAAYESILNEDNTNAEAHWCAVLCRYGIEYVEDPRTRERVPTCHRTQYAPILTDADYLVALEYAEDSYTRGLYESEAKKISEIQKGILAISGLEEPFDVFICYKETTDGGSRTKDSTIAQDIYYQLTNEGYRVFFSKITLEEKLGQAYEPYIFAALNSAKVMLVIGTKAEHFNAVWVKNEWSRFLMLMKGDHSRLLIPCYRDMDAYDLPDELAMYQSQDMGKIGFMQDLIRGIKKVLGTGKAANIDAHPSAASSDEPCSAPESNPKHKRAVMFLEDGDYEQAEEYFRYVSVRVGSDLEYAFRVGTLFLAYGEFERADHFFDAVLDKDPEYAPAYIGRLCAELKMRQEDLLIQNKKPLTDYNHYKKALRYATVDYRAQIEGYNQPILERMRQEKYNRLVQMRKKTSTEKQYQELAEQFRAMKGYENSTELAIECDNYYRKLKENREEAQRLEQKQCEEQAAIEKHKRSKKTYEEAAKEFKEMMNIKARTSIDYKNLAEGFLEMAEKFQSLEGFENANEYALQCKYRAKEYDRLSQGRKRIDIVKVMPGAVVQGIITMVYIYILYDLNNADAPSIFLHERVYGWLQGMIASMILVGLYALAIGIVSFVLLRKSGFGIGTRVITFAVGTQALIYAIFQGPVGFLAFSILFRFFRNCIGYSIAAGLGIWLSTCAEKPVYGEALYNDE